MKPNPMHVEDRLLEISDGPVGAVLATAYAVGCRKATVRDYDHLTVDLWRRGQPRPLMIHTSGAITDPRGVWALLLAKSRALEELLAAGLRPGLVVAHGRACHPGYLYRTGENTADVLAAYLRFAPWADAREGFRESDPANGWGLYEEVTTALMARGGTFFAEWFRLGNYVGEKGSP